VLQKKLFLLNKILNEWELNQDEQLTYTQLRERIWKFSREELSKELLSDIDTNGDEKISMRELADYCKIPLGGIIDGLAEIIRPNPNLRRPPTPGLRTRSFYEQLATDSTPEQSWARRYKSALQLYYNIGRKNWIEDIPTSSTATPNNSPNNSPTNSPVDSPVNSSINVSINQSNISIKSIRQSSIHPPSPIVLIFKLIKKTICCSCNKSKSGNQQQQKQTEPENQVQPRLRRHHELKKDFKGIKKGDKGIEWDGWISDQQPTLDDGEAVTEKDIMSTYNKKTSQETDEEKKIFKKTLQEIKKQNNKAVASKPYARYYYGKIIKVSKKSEEEIAGKRYRYHFGDYKFRPYCLVKFNDGVMTERAVWISEARIEKFEKHYCYHRRIQHHRFWTEGLEEHRHWCYGSPPTNELGGGPKNGSTLDWKIKKQKKRNSLLGWMKRKSLRGKALWYSGCTQCEDCKEYFCRGHIQSHRIDSDKGCQKGFMNVKNEY